jgi:chaperone modulatory protein CbpM
MSDDAILLQFLDEATDVALDELLAASGLARGELLELIELGVFDPRPDPGGAGTLADQARWRFSSRAIGLGRRAVRLRDDFGLNVPGMALALAYLERIEALERRLRELECQLLR